MLSVYLTINEDYKELARRVTSKKKSLPMKRVTSIYSETLTMAERYTILLENLKLDLELGHPPEDVVRTEIHNIKKDFITIRHELIAYCNIIWYSGLPNDLKLFCGSSLMLLLNSPDTIEYIINYQISQQAKIWQLFDYFSTGDREFRNVLAEGITVRQTEIDDDLAAMRDYYQRIHKLLGKKGKTKKSKKAFEQDTMVSG